MTDSSKEPLLDKKKGREILQLKAKEVSVVDRPAILREFLVVKRQNTEDSMGAFEPETTADNSASEVMKGMEELPNIEWLEVAAEKADLPADLKTAIQRVVQFLGKVVGGDYPSPKEAGKANVKKELPADLKTAIQRVVQFLGKVAGGKYPYPKPTGMSKANKPEDEMTDEEKQKAKEAEEAKAKEEEEKKKAKAKADEMKAAEEDTKKSASEGLSIRISPDGGVEVTGQPVAKAGKSQFTGERTSELKGAVQKLLTMLATVDQAAAKGLIEELVKSVLPADLKWTPGTEATPAAAVRKSVEEVLAPIAKQLGDLTTRFESIEKSRPAPKSETGDGDTKVEKRSDNAWDGLPLPR
jgi:flagellar motor protein MotB